MKKFLENDLATAGPATFVVGQQGMKEASCKTWMVYFSVLAAYLDFVL